ncbi:hypothetical protein EV363DRAFT_1205489, partial [Boletus edulis]
MPKTRIDLLEENITKLQNEFLKEKEVIRRKEKQKLAKGNNKAPMIPKPKGRPGRAGPDSYNVMNAMKISKDQYNLVAYLDVNLPMSKQPNKLMIDQVLARSSAYMRCLLAQTQFPKLKDYEGNWATRDIMAQYLRNRSSRERQVTQEAKILFPVKKSKRKVEEVDNEEVE